MEASGDSQSRQPDHANGGARSRRGWLLSAGLALTAGAALRVWMLNTSLFEVNGDSLVYGGIAKNVLLHRWYALTTGAGITYSTLIRLPGYPLFLALCFRLFGIENYFAVVCLQIVAELAGCLLLASFARQAARRVRFADDVFAVRAGLATLWLGALCPFTASYAVRPMTETLTIFTIALAMWSMGRFHERPAWGVALTFTFAVTAATLLRPDGALVAVAFSPVILMRLARSNAEPRVQRPSAMIIVCVLLALAPFAVWGWRNWQVFHLFQPLAPRSATDPDERTNPGWERWFKTWSLDFVSTEEVYWYVAGDTLNVNALPNRAFDSPEQYQETLALAREYNQDGKKMTDALDAGFYRLADQRISSHPLRFHLWLPVGRMLDMWLRPRNENLPVSLDWWNFSRHPRETIFNWFYIVLNAAFLLLALIGSWLRPRFLVALLGYVFLRSCLLLTIAGPEARYTLECFPMIFVLGGVAIAALMRRSSRSSSARSILWRV